MTATTSRSSSGARRSLCVRARPCDTRGLKLLRGGSGESGAGKTEETKLTLQFLAEVAKGEMEDGKLGPEQLLLQSSPIMEALGNAKTVRNNNSSRFVRPSTPSARAFPFQLSWLVAGQIHADLVRQEEHDHGWANDKVSAREGRPAMPLQPTACAAHAGPRLTGRAQCAQSRVINPGVGERNYHVFYLIDHLPDAKKKELKYTGAESYIYCNKGGCTTVEGIDDASDMKDFMQSWETQGVPSAEVDSILRTITGICYLGNIQFEGDDESSVANDEVLEDCGALFSNDPELLETTLTFRNMQSGGRSIVVIPLKKGQAIETQEGLGKAAYSRVFDWVVDRLNVSVAPPTPEKNAIGVLDIFGFEIFETNSFEQLCINLANEKLQSHFNDHIFKMELKIYEAEGLDVAGITFADNQPCLDMIEKKPKGIFPMIDEECVVPKGTDTTLLNKLQDTHRKNPFFGKPPKGTKSIFVVNHYAGGVSYDVLNFLEKNRDMLQPDIQAFMAESQDSFVADMFPAPKATRGRAPTLGGQFRSSLQELYDQLNSTDPHFIKCLKTNEVKKAGIFDGEYCLRQITYLGLLEVVNIRRQGFPVRRDPALFMTRYKVLDEDCKDAKALLTKLGMAGKWQMGKTMVFMKDEQFLELETQRGLRLEKSVVTIQKFLRDQHARKQWQKYQIGFLLAQQVVRGFQGRKLRAELKKLVDARKLLDDAIAAAEPRWPPAPDKASIDAAIKAGTGLGSVHGLDGTEPLVDKCKTLLDRIKAEEPVYSQLEAAVNAKDEAEVTDALAAAKAINFEHELVTQGQAFLDDEKDKRENAKRRQEEEEARLGAEAAAAAKAERLAAVKAAVEEAIALPDDDLMAKRKALNAAVSRAEEEEVTEAVVDEAKEMIAVVGKKISAERQIDEAVEDADTDALKDAISKAEGAGVAAEKVEKAKLELEKIEAAAEFDEAIDGKDQAKMDAAYERCKACGLEVEKPVKGKKPRKMTAAQKSSRKGQKQLLEDISLMQYGARLAEMESVFVLKKFHGLRRMEEDEELEFRKTDLERPLCKYNLEDAEKTNEMESKAKATFSNMLGYMGEKYHQYPELLASQIIQDGIDNEVLRDEIYLQVVMEIINNSTFSSLKRAWQLMSLLVKTFPPSADFHPFLEVFYYHATHGEHNTVCVEKQKEKDTIIQIAQVCLRKLDAIVESGAKETAPSEEEVKALRAEQPIMLSVYFTDHSFKKFQIDEDLKASDLLTSISATLKVKMIDTYALYDVSQLSDPIVVEPETKILELMNDWQKVVKLGKGRFAKKCAPIPRHPFGRQWQTSQLT